jgi:hypothetical protein
MAPSGRSGPGRIEDMESTERLTVSIADLRAALARVLDAVEDRFGEVIDLDADHDWLIESTGSFDLSRAPEVVAGQLSDDVETIDSTEEVFIWHDLDHLIGVLRRIAAIDASTGT